MKRQKAQWEFTTNDGVFWTGSDWTRALHGDEIILTRGDNILRGKLALVPRIGNYPAYTITVKGGLNIIVPSPGLWKVWRKI